MVQESCTLRVLDSCKDPGARLKNRHLEKNYRYLNRRTAFPQPELHIPTVVFPFPVAMRVDWVLLTRSQTSPIMTFRTSIHNLKTNLIASIFRRHLWHNCKTYKPERFNKNNWKGWFPKWISFSRGPFSGSTLVFGGVIIAIAYSFSAIYSFYNHHWYPSSHYHGSVENGCISEKSYLSFRVAFHFMMGERET